MTTGRQLQRSAATRRKPYARQWFLTSWPRVALRCNKDNELVYASFTIPIDVPSKPRATRESKMLRPDTLDFYAWKRIFIPAMKDVLSAQGLEVELPILEGSSASDLSAKKVPLFSEILKHEPSRRPMKSKHAAPLLVSGLIATKLNGDWDNRVKSVLDACNSVLWEDDSQTVGGPWTIIPAENIDAYCKFTVQFVPQDTRVAYYEALYNKHITTIVEDFVSIERRIA